MLHAVCLQPDLLGVKLTNILVTFVPFLFFFSLFRLFFGHNEAMENTHFNNTPISQTFSRFFLFRNLSSCVVFVRCMSYVQNRRRIQDRTVLCKLSLVIEVQGIGSVDVSHSLESS
jgi:hypothetical protein